MGRVDCLQRFNNTEILVKPTKDFSIHERAVRFAEEDREGDERRASCEFMLAAMRFGRNDRQRDEFDFHRADCEIVLL